MIIRLNASALFYLYIYGGGGGVFFATKLNPMVESHRPECLAKIFNCCVKGQSHSESAEREGGGMT